MKRTETVTKTLEIARSLRGMVPVKAPASLLPAVLRRVA